MSHNTKCIFCLGKKPSYLVKYKWEAMFELFNATQNAHQSAYLSNEFARKGFWDQDAKEVHWKIRQQGAKHRPKISAMWQELKGKETDKYCEFQVQITVSED